MTAVTPVDLTTPFRVVPVGDSTLLVEFEPRIDPVINGRAVALARAIEAAAVAGVREVVPTYRSVAIFFDPLRTDANRLGQLIEHSAESVGSGSIEATAPIQVPACYGLECGCAPDLKEVARFGGISAEEVIAIHTGTAYRVFMLGFLPGFAYMGVVDERIAVSRRDMPRPRVPKGSVGIAGRQTGIYPSDAPGGWQLIGRTPLDPFDLGRPSPFLFQAGDRIQFVPIHHMDFERSRHTSVEDP